MNAVIAPLLDAASREASLVMQYSLDARDLRFHGLKKLAAKFCSFGDTSRQYLEEIVDRILYLDGEPSYAAQPAAALETITDTLNRALVAENSLVDAYNAAAITAMNAKDDNTRNKFEHWIKYHEDNRIAWLARQLAQIELITEVEYIKVQLART